METSTRITLRWRDMDLLGHLNQSVYHELLEEGRWALLSGLRGETSSPFVLVRIELDYRHEIRRQDGHVDVVSRVGELGRTSVTVEHELLLPDGTAAAVGRAVMVAWDREARRSRGLSEQERALLTGDRG